MLWPRPAATEPEPGPGPGAARPGLGLWHPSVLTRPPGGCRGEQINLKLGGRASPGSTVATVIFRVTYLQVTVNSAGLET